MLRLLFILSTSCIVWGVLTAAYFGIKIPPGVSLATSLRCITWP